MGLALRDTEDLKGRKTGVPATFEPGDQMTVPTDPSVLSRTDLLHTLFGELESKNKTHQLQKYLDARGIDVICELTKIGSNFTLYLRGTTSSYATQADVVNQAQLIFGHPTAEFAIENQMECITKAEEIDRLIAKTQQQVVFPFTSPAPPKTAPISEE